MTQQETRRWVLADAFDRAAPSYDAMVALSPGYHAQLRRAADLLVARAPATTNGDPLRALDLGCGSGASTRALLDAWAAARTGPIEVVGVDASDGMVAQARTKTWPAGVDLVVEDAVTHLGALPDASVDAVFASYLLRNVPDRDALVREVGRVLRPRGGLVVHDYSVAGNPLARATWAAVCHGVVIPLAAWKRSDLALHRYLYTSVRDFDSVARIGERLAATGLVDVQRVEHPGWQRGLVHSIAATRPS
ncbi:MAG: methyltransferase domain-containing protein [Dermatophilaceae bacterium]